MATLATNGDFIIVQGKQVPYLRTMVGVGQLELDPKNPRIQFLVGQKAGMVSETELDDLLWAKDSVKALGQSIYQNGGVYEPLIVQKNGEKYRVREGNSRTVASRHLSAQYANDSRFMTVPAMVFDVNLTEEDLAVLLADMHVAGKIRWDAYEQAKHVHDLFHIYGKTYDWLSNHLRLSKGKIKELLGAYQATSEFLTLFPAPLNIRKYSFFAELMKKRELRDRFEMDPQFKQKFHKWLVDDKLTDSKQVRSLGAILANNEAVKELEKSGYDEAAKVLMRDDPSLESDLFWAIKNATAKLEEAPASDIQDLKSGNPQKIILLRNLYRAIEDLATLASVKL
ncbi:MAG TPA: hypothetical protein VFW25_06030 [Silvibacterium sp.]|nr:hypothetical protein [Silvibacterium sp.]